MHIPRETLPPLVREFLLDLDVVKNKSTLTVEEYASDLRTFFHFIQAKDSKLQLTDEPDISQLTLDKIKSISRTDVYEFLSYCKNERDNTARTRARKISTIRSFYHYLEAKDYIRDNQMTRLEMPKIPKTLPKYLTLDQSIALLNSIEGPNKERDYCMITIFLNCGIRLAELVSINFNDISYMIQKNESGALLSDTEMPTITITGKGDKQRMIYLNQACVDSIIRYARVRPRDGVVDRDALFLSGQKKRISPKTVQHIVKSYLEKIGLTEGYSVHKLRHTAATLMYQYGKVDTQELREILGHESLATTQIYTHVSNDKIRKAVIANPLSAIKQTPLKPSSENQSGEQSECDSNPTATE